MQKRPPKKLVSRQYAVNTNGTTITFECGRAKHTYKINFGTKPLHRRILMARWWSRDRGGCLGECPKCKRDTSNA